MALLGKDMDRILLSQDWIPIFCGFNFVFVEHLYSLADVSLHPFPNVVHLGGLPHVELQL